MTSSFRATASIALMLLAAPLGGCSLLKSDEPPTAIYVLHPALSGDSATAAHAGVLAVAMPALPAGFDTDRIALYWNQGRRLDYYEAARWPAPLDRLMRDFIMRSAGHAIANATVVDDLAGIPAPYRLDVKVIEFQPVYAGSPNGTPELYAALRFTLVSVPEEKVVDDFTVASHARAAGDDLTSITAGLETLLQGLLPKAFRRIGESI